MDVNLDKEFNIEEIEKANLEKQISFLEKNLSMLTLAPLTVSKSSQNNISSLQTKYIYKYQNEAYIKSKQYDLENINDIIVKSFLHL